MQIKVKALGQRKIFVKQVVSSRTPRQFHNFLWWFRVDGRVIGKFRAV